MGAEVEAIKSEKGDETEKTDAALVQAAPVKKAVKKVAKDADKAPAKIDKAAYTKEWHKEWKQGKVPSWKETYPKAALPYEDRQSDGKPSLLQAKPKDAKKAKAAAGPKYDDKAFAEAWGTEWKHGDVPTWKETYPTEPLNSEARPSDGKRDSFLQQEPKEAKADEAEDKEKKEAKEGEEAEKAEDTEEKDDAEEEDKKEDKEEAKEEDKEEPKEADAAEAEDKE